MPNIIRRRVLVNCFISSKLTNKETSIIDTTKGYYFIENIRVLQEEIKRMVSTH